MSSSTPEKIHFLLTPAQRKGALALLGLMVVGMIMEILGIGLIIPVVALLTQPDLAAKYPNFQPWLATLGNPTQPKLVMFAIAALVGIYLLKNLFLAFLAWHETRFAFDVQAQLSHRLFAAYLYQPYTFHLQRNSATLIRNVTTEVSLFTKAIISTLALLGEAFVLVGMAGLLVLAEPLGALVVVLVVGTAAWYFHSITRGKVSHWGKTRQYHEGLRIQHLQQGLGGAKDVKLLGRESEFLAQYGKHNLQSARVSQFQAALQLMPRLWLEMLAVTGLAVLILTMVVQGRDMSSIVATLALFAAAAFRLIPSVNRVLAGLQTLRFCLPVINILHDELRLVMPEPVSVGKRLLPFHSEIQLFDVGYTYPSASARALDGVSLRIRKGASIGFVGPSGSGKSTLADVILGLLAPSAGRVLVDGQDIQENLRGWQDQIGYVPQSIYLTDDTLMRNVAFGLPIEQIDEAAVRRAIVSAQLDEFVAGLPDGLNTMVGERGIQISGGQRQRIGIARALYHSPQVLVLDEATSALDNLTEQSVMEALHNLRHKITIIIIAHRLTTVHECDCIYLLEKGQLVGQGAYKELANTNQRFQDMLRLMTRG